MTLSLPTTTRELALDVLRQHAAKFAEHAPQVGADSDPEHVHQTRVATRRMRAALRVFGDVLPQELGNLDDELKWIAGLLGAVRDLDVQIARLHDIAVLLGETHAVAPYGAWLEEQRPRAMASLIGAFASERFGSLTERLKCLDALAPDPDRDRPLKDDAAPRLKRAYRRLRKAGDDLDVDSPAAAFHRARIQAKRFRYAVEFLAPIYGKPAERLISRITDLQDLLGDHQDGIVSSHRIHEAVHTVAGTWPAEPSVALGRVLQWEAQHGEELRRRFPATYREVQDAWQRLRRSL
jgi:triphosphatase